MIWRGIEFGGVKLLYLVRVVVLARLLSPADFGLFAVALVALDFMLSVTNFGMVPALVHRPDATRVHYESAWTIGIVRALAVGAGLALLAPWIATQFGEPDAANLLRFLSLRPVIEATASIGLAELEKNLKFRSLALLKLSEVVVNAGVSIALVTPLGVWALVLGPLAGAVTYSVTSYFMRPIRPRLRLGGVAAGQLVRYGRWILIAAWIAVAGRTLLQLAISRQLGAVALGLYFLSAKLALLPADISTQVVGSVVFPVFSMVQAEADRARRVFRAALVGLSVLVVPSAALILVLAPSLAVDLLGPRWEPAVPIIRILAVTAIIGMLGELIVPFLQGVGRPDRTARMEAVQSVLVAGFAWIFASHWGVAGAAAAWIPAILASQILGAFYLRHEVSKPFSGLVGPLLGVLGVSAVGAAVATAADRILGGPVGVIAAAVLGGFAAYSALLVLEARHGLGLTENTARLFPWSVRFLHRLGLGHRLPYDTGMDSPE